MQPTNDSEAPRQGKQRTHEQIALPDEPDAEVLSRIVDFYHQTLKDSPEALAYLEQRGLTHPKLLETFKVGFSNRTLGYRLPPKTRKAGAAIRSQLQRLGILRDSGHEHMRGSIVVPIVGERGEVVQMYGRKVTKGLRKGTALHLYLPGPRHGLFNPQALAADGHVVVCASIIDTMTFWCAGIQNVTCTFGPLGFTEEQYEAFRRHNIQHVTIAYRRDAEGDRAAQTLAERFAKKGIRAAHGIQFPKGMDANAYALKAAPAERTLAAAIRRAVWLAGSKSSAQVPPMQASEPTPRPPGPMPGGAEPKLPLVPMEATEHEQRFTLDDRVVRVRGLESNRSFDRMKVNLLVQRGDRFFVDSVDLYLARQRATFVKQAADELGIQASVLKSDLGKVLLALESVQEEAIEASLASKEPPVVLSPEEHEEALALLRDPTLLETILADFERCGVVGEETNKLAGYLGCISRKLERPLAMIVQSTSAAGKSALLESVLAFVPDEECAKYSAMTAQSLYYLGQDVVKHKVLALAEEEGAERATYALKLLQSEGELAIASTGKDAKTGKLVTTQYRVEGPVMLLLTSTAIEMDEELLNRCLVLTVDEGAAQTAAIHKAQRESRTLQGLLGRRERESIVKRHQNAQQLLRPLPIVNPYADQLTFAVHRTRMRRDHQKYLSLIDSVALLHQYQREVKTVMHEGEAFEYIEVTAADIAIANQLAHKLLGRSLDDLPPQTRRLLGLVHEMVQATCEAAGTGRADVRFSRRQVRQHSGWSYEQIRVHLGRLVDMEYLIVHRGARGRTFVYELCHDGDTESSAPQFSGLIDVSTREDATTTSGLGHEQAEIGGPYRGQTGPLPEALAGPNPVLQAEHRPDSQHLAPRGSETANQEEHSNAESYSQAAKETHA